MERQKSDEQEVVVEQVEKGEDCVFNNDIYGLTTEWANEAGFSKFIWNDNMSQLKIPFNSDTIVLAKGGCIHFQYYVEIRLYSDTASISNIEHWKSLALELANRFKFDQYSKTLATNEFVRVEGGKDAFWLEIKDDDLEDNILYNGVEVDLEGDYKFLALSTYVN